jgi:hypothetical protein
MVEATWTVIAEEMNAARKEDRENSLYSDKRGRKRENKKK